MLYVNRLPALGGHLWRIVNDRARKTRSRGNPQSKEHHVILKIVWFGIVLKCTPALRERSGDLFNNSLMSCKLIEFFEAKSAVKPLQYFKPIILADGLLLPATLSQS